MISLRLLPPKLFYFFWFGGIGALTPFLGPYYREIGMPISQIGVLAAMPGLFVLIASPIWGIVADALQLRRVLLPLAIVGTLLPVLLIGQARSFGGLLPLVAAHALFTSPVVALADSATLHLLGEARTGYGAQRVWGSVGWTISTLVFGGLVERSGLSACFIGYAVLAVLAALSALALPRGELRRPKLGSSAVTLLRDRAWLSLLGCAMLMGCCGALIASFLSLYLQDLGASGQQIGIAFALASISELPIMLLSPWMLRRWGARPLLMFAGVLYALRVVVFIVAPGPDWVLAGQLLHGLCYGILWTSGVVEVQRLAPPGLEATAQSLFGIAAIGIAAALASLLGGGVYQEFGAAVLFGAGGISALLGSLGLGIGLYNQAAARRS